ncbi:TPA: hypothetical protein DCG61_03185 [Patescibacteria group bacterium]|jgi:hypothetical protein|nr:hypothetical protein [Patescibacteria group bacterium]
MNTKIIVAIIAVVALSILLVWSLVLKDKNQSEINSSNETVQDKTPDNENESTTPEPEQAKPDNTEAVLPTGHTRISGTFSMYAIGIAPDTLCFTPDAGNPTYCFENQAEAKLMLNTNSAGKLDGDKCEQISGKASIVYSSFKEGYYNTGGGSVRLEKVDRIIEPAKCGPVS